MLKNAVHSSRFPVVHRVLTSVLVLLAVFASAGPLLAQGFDPLKKPVAPVPVPQNWSGALRPTKILGDSSWWNFGSTPTNQHPFWHDVDVENGWVFATTGRGLQVFDARTAPNSPTPSPINGQYFFASTATIPVWHQNDTKFYLFGLDAPAGNDTVVAVASISDNGMLIFDTRNKEGVARLAYQDNAKSGTQVWSTTFNNTHYAFYAATNNKVLVYNLSAALNIQNPNNSKGCLDESPASIPCQDSQGRKVYVGKLNTQTGATYLHGAGNFLAVSQGFLGVEIWQVGNPLNPQKLQTVTPPGVSAGVAMWQDGGSYYLAVVQLGNNPPRSLRIYDVTCVTVGGCSAGPPLVGTYQMNHAAPTSILFATFSRAAGAPYLYLGGEDQFSGGPQREYLVDVSNPASPVEVTPPFPPTGYWGWYYYGLTPPGQAGGYNWVMPRTAKLATIGGTTHLYRAAFSLLDVHAFGGNTPTAGFSYSPATIYAGDPVDFTDQSSGALTSWSWTFSPDGAPPTSTAQNPQNVTFASPGTKTVTLQINGNGDSDTQSLTVLNPTPVVGDITINPASPRVCQRISFAGVGVTGKPPLTYAWEVLDASGSPLLPSVTGSGTTFDWNTNAGTQAAGYRIKLTVNGQGSGSHEEPFTLQALTPLPGAGFPLTDPPDPQGATVSFELPATSAPSASEWSWNFGDNLAGPNGGWTPWNADPVTGPRASHTYTAIGTYNVKVRVRNCVEPAGPANELGIESQAVSVTITQLINLQAVFSALCPLGFCSFGVGEPVPFADASTGAAFWDYDWNGDGTFEDANRTAPALSHVYTAAGRYRPRLRVRLASGDATSIAQLAQELNVVQTGPPPTPTITVSGSTSANVGQSVTLTASASNCTAASNGWTWDTAGGTGSSTTNSISLSWASAGAKIVRASNTGCSGAQPGTRTVTVSGGSTGPVPLQARFTYSPIPALPNQAVSFNGSTSTGNPTIYLWDFGDGTPTVSGAQVTHTFTQQGTYNVKLMVSAPSSACPPQPFCEHQTQQAVVVVGPTLGASFNSEICHAELSFVVCNTDVNVEVTFTDASVGNIVSRTWDFGDGSGTATGTVVRHTYTRAGTFQLTLTVSDGTRSVNFSRPIIVAGPLTEAMVLPWIAKTAEGPLLQISDLYLHNPGVESIDVTLEFRQRGAPETVPPRVTRTIAGNATLFASDLVKSLFNRENITGFLNVTVDRGGIQPVMTSFNTTFRNNGNGDEFGQTIPVSLLSNTGAASSTGNNQVQYLVGMNDNRDRFAYFGLSNPGPTPVTYRLRFFDNLGQEIGTGSPPLTLARFGFKQYQPRDIRTQFGLGNKDDYRVLVESPNGAPVFPFGANLRHSTLDPSFLGVGTGAERVYLLGMLSTPGANNSIWRSDVVLSNISNQVAITDLTYVNVGTTNPPTDTVRETLQAGESRRLEDVIGTKWNIRNGVGVLTIESDVPGGVFPLIQGESYENTNPAQRYGQTVLAATDEQAAGTGQGQYLVGLREDAKYRSTFWVFNPGTEPGSYDIVFRGLDGQELGRTRNYGVPAGKLRQLNKAQFPPGLTGSFTVQVIVRSGKALTAAQVVNNKTNDPAYILGETR